MVHNAVSIKSTHSTIQLGIFSYTPLHDRAQRGWNCEKEEKLEGQREESIALPSARPQTSTVVDLAEHFNDSSLPRAFTVPQSLVLASRACTRVRWNNSWTTEHHGVHTLLPLFHPSFDLSHHRHLRLLLSTPLHALVYRLFSTLFVLPSRFSIRKKKKKRISRNPLLVLEPSIFYSFFPPSHFDLPLTIANENRRFSSLKNLGGFQVFFFFCFFWSTGNHFASLLLLILKNFWWWREGWGKGRAEFVILYQGKKRFLICHCENDEVVALFKWVKLFWFEREGNIW